MLVRIVLAWLAVQSLSGCTAAVLVGATLFSAGVDTIEHYRMQSRFAPADAAHILKYGTGHISGRVWLAAPDGTSAVGRGVNVQLIPATEYSIEYIKALFGDTKTSIMNVSIDNLDPRFFQYIRHTTTDPDGLYSFGHVPHGNYFLMTFIKWKGRENTHDPGQTRVANKATLAIGERITVDLNGE